MEEIIKVVQVNSGDAEMVIYPENVKLAIEKNWESLYFSENKDDFAWVSNGKNIIVLTTRGEVRISQGNVVLRNKDENEIRKILDSDKNIYEDDAVLNNNWFSIEIGDVINHKQYNTSDEFPFESTPKSIEELESLLIEIFNQYY